MYEGRDYVQARVQHHGEVLWQDQEGEVREHRYYGHDSMKLTRADVDKDELVETDEGVGKSAWREHHGKVVVWKDGRGGILWMYSYDDDEHNN